MKSNVIDLDQNDEQTLDQLQTHFLLFTSCDTGVHLPDDYRSELVNTLQNETKCYAVTLVIDGDYSVLEVIHNDLKARRPVIIIHGSGHLANILGNLLEKARNNGRIE